MTGEPLIIVLGPTAVGKTDVAIHLAQALNADVISADSRQIYRHMDIGTAKPTFAQQQQATHHLIDIVEPTQTLSLAQYVHYAKTEIDRQHQLGRPALLVGGTGQYLTAIEEGWSVPEVAPDTALRAELEAFSREHGAIALHQRLATLDPESAVRIHHNNVRRIIRAIEVCITTGTTMTALQQKRPVSYRTLVLGLNLERDDLYARADARVDHMIRQGLIDEVKQLVASGYNPRLPALSSIGYQELIAYLNDECTLEDAIIRIKFNTHNYIRRQLIWFRGHDNGILWHNMAQTSADDLVLDVLQWLRSNQ